MINVCHWKSHNTFLFKASTAAGAGNGDQGEILKLQRTIKVITRASYSCHYSFTQINNTESNLAVLAAVVQELREEMSREVDEHQHELTAVQDAQRQKMADVTRRHREELAEYEERIEELEEQIQSGQPRFDICYCDFRNENVLQCFTKYCIFTFGKLFTLPSVFSVCSSLQDTK